MANGQMFEYSGLVKPSKRTSTMKQATLPSGLPSESQGPLRHGETGNVIATSPYKNALIIPQKANVRNPEKKYVFVIDKDDIVHQREITIAAGDSRPVYHQQACPIPKDTPGRSS